MARLPHVPPPRIKKPMAEKVLLYGQRNRKQMLSSDITILYYYFTKKRSLKIFKIEKINRQAVDKNTLT